MTHRIPSLWILALRYGIYFAFAWGAVCWRRWQKRRQENTARSWPSVEARILSGWVAPVPKTSCFLATLEYAYFVGEYRTGQYIHEFPRESDADDFVRALANRRMPVRYDQANPGHSVLEQRVVEHHFQLTPRIAGIRPPAPDTAEMTLPRPGLHFSGSQNGHLNQLGLQPHGPNPPLQSLKSPRSS